MSDKEVYLEVKDYVATITINRPKQLNAFTGDNIVEMQRLLDVAANDRKVGVIVLTGTGDRAFCVGGDVNWEKGSGGKSGLEDLNFTFNRQIVECPKPVIARVSGYAIGGGHHIAYFCDLTVAADHSIFGQNGPRVGSPAGGYIVSHAANVLGHKRARELWMLCRRYTAQQALDWGLANSVVPKEKLDDEVRKFADELLALSPTCLRILKRSFYHHMAPIMQRDMKELIEEVAPNYFETGEQLEGATAFLEKRKPDFSRFR
ncbi:1,4-dihydroxy-6-naphthoate synthase [Variovorax paradoxus]|jgi:dihydroxynaphthoic acid synthetase|uniref:enoyl-CoA hydratase-related protein n=1 Tax=Comamonadaceae TaxID=80864 RepID=UPI000571C6B3|nr:enoyl-CoA hydratase-related protein [Xenophilus azovorans]KPU99501.1 1,4-dihydroxy-6-naphthoate synthase [Variovorax paradoxus]MBN8747273.1 enoyl-CoA hydratase/isomerase family protein [Variovorax sp.]VTY39542.1 1,4-dihydroxy-2-naphthoyl-CoA synthase [Xylophilus ampelinus]KPV07523.1 1,4-dihydroxy-6-naphthoate synthase [Variovorax paradoxus]KPV07772.1 1,4-dihydroxy-6-naphthoate synthase [Variovorax paradoxus]